MSSFILGIIASGGAGAAAITYNKIAFTTNSSPYVQAYPWADATGYGTKYANPATLPLAEGRGVAFRAAGGAIAVGHQYGGSAQYIAAYPWSDSTGFGTKYANPATVPGGAVNSVKWSPNGSYIFTADFSSSPAYNWSSGFGSKLADPATPVTYGQGVDVSSANNRVIYADGLTSPYIYAYPFTTSFGTKYANPATLPTGQGNGVAFNPAATATIIGHYTSPYLTGYPFSSGFGTKYANPATLPDGDVFSVAFSTDGAYAAVGNQSGSTYVFAYPFNSSTGFGTKLANPSTLPTGPVYRVSFSTSAIALSHYTSPFQSSYAWSAGFGTRYANPATALPNHSEGNSFGVTG